jgi:hypothetical protein
MIEWYWLVAGIIITVVVVGALAIAIMIGVGNAFIDWMFK